MRFEISETVYTPDLEMVLRALEMCSRDVSSDVVRYGDKITVHGLGPSPRTKNIHDTTIFRVNAEDDLTVIHGDVNFQASALLGDQPQQEVVRSKLEDLFSQMKARINLNAGRVSAHAMQKPVDTVRMEAESAGTAKKTVTTVETLVAPIAPERLMEATNAAPDEGPAAGLIGEGQTLGGSRPIYGWEIPKEFRPVALEEQADWLREEEGADGFPWQQFVLHVFALLSLSLVVAGAYFGYMHYQNLGAPPPATEPGAMAANPPPTSEPDAMVASPPPTSEPDAMVANPPPTSDTRREDATTQAAAPQRGKAGAAEDVGDLKVWLQNWAAAMRTRDAEAQAAFYAYHVDQYLDQRQVSRNEVLRHRAATLRMRKGLWTVKIEKIAIVRQTDAEAEVHLIKHFIDEPEQSEILESFVPTRLLLRRTNGNWRIISEQDES
jgi:ketosteroid isomerase-like protein